MQPNTESLPRHDRVGILTRVLEVASLVGAAGLVLLHLTRFATAAGMLTWSLLPAILAGLLFADFVSGLVHWIADTWGSESMPVLGRRFLRPFRVHHLNPDDFLRRDFIDTNGDVSMIAIPILLSALLFPLDSDLGMMAAVFLVAFCACALPTNQVHQWAHMSAPPLPISWLQRYGVILSQKQHQRHHTAPYSMNYCITTGWCNRVLTALRFFPALEWVVSRLTGLRPRDDDLTFADLNHTAAQEPQEIAGENRR